ncbi:hypothetical protein HUJ04_007267, partial [Dendroctonus ponderosae]
MEFDVPEDVPVGKKRPLEDSIDEVAPKQKKPKLYSVKQFRKQLQSTEKLQALTEFSALVASNSKHDYIFDYLKDGGNCLELLQALEHDSSIPPSIVFDIINHLLLRISAKYGQYYTSAYESCRYLLNNYLSVVHKMLGLSSSKQERKACLKLLTAMATFSSNLAKDILLKVKFHSANIELLSKPTGEKNSVRDSFIHFLIAFMVDSDWHILSILLEKSGLLTRVISGLQYDDADTVCMIITVMKNHILENSFVRKTTKMHVFNTAVVKDLVNLYNWKGSDGLKAMEKNNKTIYEVDKIAKSKVSECLHDFLLVLCTSYKFGLIFSDPLVGLGKKHVNGLMFTVLDSLDRPWEHSYASDLVIKICRSCPDLTKVMWITLKPFLEPRLTEKWLNAMSFTKRLIDEMKPSCIEYCAKDLSAQQLAQVIEVLVSPSAILSGLIDAKPIENKGVKVHIIKLLRHMLEKMLEFLDLAKNWTGRESHTKVANNLSNYISKHYPKAEDLLEEWKTVDVSTEQEQSIESEKRDNLEVILDILNFYKTLAPQCLSNLTARSFDFKNFLFNLADNFEEQSDSIEMLQIKLVEIFVDSEQALFLPNTDVFAYIVPILLKNFHARKESTVQNVLSKLLRNTGIFDSGLYEINIWLNGIFNFDTFVESFAEDFVEFFKDANANLLDFQKELSQMAEDEGLVNENENVIETLMNMSEFVDYSPRKIKHRTSSVAVLGLLKYLPNSRSKSIKKYAELVLLNLFHSQTRIQKFVSVIQTYSDVIPSNVFNYITNWSQHQFVHLAKVKGSLTVFKDIGDNFLNKLITLEMLESNGYPDLLVDILRMTTFYVANLVSNKSLSEDIATNWITVVDCIVKGHVNLLEQSCLDLILSNPCLIKHFDFLASQNHVWTKSLLVVVKKLQEVGVDLDQYKPFYSGRIYQNIGKILKNPSKYNVSLNIKDFLQVFPLDYPQAAKIVEQICQLPFDKYISGESSPVSNILNYSLSRILELVKVHPELAPFDKKVVLNLTALLVGFNKENLNSSAFATNLRSYFAIFPHNISDVDKHLFSSILTMSEYNKESVDLAVFLLETNLKLVSELEENVSTICEKKGLILPIVHILANNSAPEEILQKIYENMESSLIKAIQKPQKVGQHFLKDYDIAILVEKFMPVEKCASFADKVQKFEVAEIFHAKLLEACYNKTIENDISEKKINNIIMTFVHLEISVLKRAIETEEEINKVNKLSDIFMRIMDKLVLKNSTFQFAINDSFKTFCKFSLKYGLSGQFILLRLLGKLIKTLSSNLSKDDAAIFLDMLLSHSEFLNVALGEHSETKLELLTLIFILCDQWNEIMERNHVPVLLSAYRGMVTRCDRIVLALLTLYESKPEQTRFYDFKPFLCGRLAATHYSVRTQIASSLMRQPKTSDVLEILREDLVNSTITTYPLEDCLRHNVQELSKEFNCYDLKFFLPLFSHILAPEQQIRTYVFIRSGALSLTVLGLGCQDKEVRQAASHVLARLHFHLEGRQVGKDNMLWIRFVEALCKGAANLPNFKLNTFSAIFFARMALILTNPKHIMFSPLSLYLTAKQDLDLSTIPELYTLLFSSEVNFADHRKFILKILRDGMRTDKDFLDFLRSMAYKLFSELYSSCVSDADCRLLVLDIMDAICKIPLGVKMLTENFSFLVQLGVYVTDICSSSDSALALPKVVRILLNIAKIRTDIYASQTVLDICQQILESSNFLKLKGLEYFFETLFIIGENHISLLQDQQFIAKVISTVNDRFCNYIQQYGCGFVSEKCTELQESGTIHFL